jgi:secreted Zn-dependent insulinase-like peptidase
MDEAIVELLDKFKEKIEEMNKDEFENAKQRTFDILAFDRFDLEKMASIHFHSITKNIYDFKNFSKIEKYSHSLNKDDIKSFFERIFINRNNLKFTVYVKKYLFI